MAGIKSTRDQVEFAEAGRQSRGLKQRLILAAVALAHRAGMHPLAATALVVGAACAPLYRNVINIRLQPLVPDPVRASLVSVEAWVGAAYYALFFPVGGWLVDATGVVTSYSILACWMALSLLPLLLWARAQRL